VSASRIRGGCSRISGRPSEKHESAALEGESMHVLIHHPPAARCPRGPFEPQFNLQDWCGGWTRRGVTKELPGYLTFASSHPLVLLQDSSEVKQNVVLLGLLVLPIR
jgi:hypothetical protein